MKPMKILLVDDSKSARYALRLQLQRHGIEVETENAAESALTRIRETPPDAVFMDHTMPGMNGFEALDILKATPATRHIPVVMCNSNDDLEFIARAARKGALDILSKSTTPERLKSLLDRLQQAISTPASVAEAAPAHQSTAEMTRAASQSLTENGVDERIRSLTAPLLKEFAQHLKADLAAKTEQQLASGLEEKSVQLQKRLIKAHNEQAQLATERLINDLLPEMVKQHIEEERRNIARMVQQLIDAYLDGLVEKPGFVRRILETTEGAAVGSSGKAVRHQEPGLAETGASDRAGALADRLLKSMRPDPRPMYLLAAGAASVGIASASVVFFLLS